MIRGQTICISLVVATVILVFSANLLAGIPMAVNDADPFEQGRAEGKMFVVILFVVAAAIFVFVKWRKKK